MNVVDTEERRWHTHRRYLYLLAKWTLVGAALWLAALAFDALAPVLAPVLVSLLIAYLVDPLIDAIERIKVPRTVAILGVALVLLVGIATLMVVVVPVLVQELRATLEKLPALWERYQGQWASFLETQLGVGTEELRAAAQRVGAAAHSAALAALAHLGKQVNAFLNALLISVFVFYFLRDFDRLKLRPLELVPPRYRAYVIERARAMDRVVGGWARKQAQVAIILAALYAAGLSVVGIRLSVVIGLVTGLLNVIPYVGTATGFVLAMLMVLVEGPSLYAALGVLAVFAVVQLLEGYLITPRLVGSAVGMRPLAVLVVLFIGGSLFGLIGLLLAVPTVAAARVLLDDVLAAYKRSELWRGPDATPQPSPAVVSEEAIAPAAEGDPARGASGAPVA